MKIGALETVVALATPVVLTAMILVMIAARYSNAQNDISGLAEQNARLRALAAFKIGPEADDAAPQLSSFYLGPGTPAERSAQIVAAVSNIALANNLQVLRTIESQPIQQGSHSLVGSSVELSGPMSGILGALDSIRRNRPLLVIQRLTIRADAAYQPGNGQEKMLSLALDLYGLQPPAEP